jgi:hypothetical protein
VLYSLQDHLRIGTHDLDHPVSCGCKNHWRVATTLIPSAIGALDVVRVRTTIHDVDLVHTIILNAFWACATIFDTDPVCSTLLNVDPIHARLQPVATVPRGGGVS